MNSPYLLVSTRWQIKIHRHHYGKLEVEVGVIHVWKSCVMIKTHFPMQGVSEIMIVKYFNTTNISFHLLVFERVN